MSDIDDDDESPIAYNRRVAGRQEAELDDLRKTLAQEVLRRTNAEMSLASIRQFVEKTLADNARNEWKHGTIAASDALTGALADIQQRWPSNNGDELMRLFVAYKLALQQIDAFVQAKVEGGPFSAERQETLLHIAGIAQRAYLGKK